MPWTKPERPPEPETRYYEAFALVPDKLAIHVCEDGEYRLLMCEGERVRPHPIGRIENPERLIEWLQTTKKEIEDGPNA